MEINVDFDIRVVMDDGTARTFALDKTVEVPGDNKRMVKAVRIQATKAINDICAQIAAATGYGYSGQPVVQDYSHRLARVSDEGPGYEGSGNLHEIEVRRTEQPRIQQAKAQWGSADSDPGTEDDEERKAKGCTHPSDQPCFPGQVHDLGSDKPEIHPEQEAGIPFFDTTDGTIGSDEDDVPPNAGSSS